MVCDPGGTEGIIPTRTSMHIGQKGNPLRNRTIAEVKVQWKHFGPDEATWEMEDAMRQEYPILFTSIHAIHVSR